MALSGNIVPGWIDPWFFFEGRPPAIPFLRAVILRGGICPLNFSTPGGLEFSARFFVSLG
jgi:hypothetical protein